MIKFLKTDLEATNIIVEPGDLTRYDFYAIQVFDDFLIVPAEKSMKYPQVFDRFDIKEAVNEVIKGIGFNPPEPNIFDHYQEIRKYFSKAEKNPFEKFERENSHVNKCTVRVVVLALYDVFNLGF